MSETHYQDVLDAIAKAAVDANRSPADVHLVAVSKQQPSERVLTVLEAGCRVFGENRVQEAQERWEALKMRFPDIRLRLIGPLQTNKVKAALDLFDAIETLDRPKLARKIAEEVQARGAAPELLVQVNTGEEPQKAGVAPGALEAFLAECGSLDLRIGGLMAIPPADEPPAPHFALLRKLAERHGLAKLSMGMSADYAIAIAMGATSVRVGSAVFGERAKPA
ncbi:MAG: YggS family pyridoxal phosphate-dependent enzyme [Neomegalonema sp.]|nr:YggS family pyridoxal phosphate-dependent enzyme [Neomegalonema sp.]